MKRLVTYIILACCTATIGYAEKDRKSNSLNKETQAVAWVQRIKQGFNMRVWLSTKMTMGMQAWDAGANEDIPDGFGLEYPNGSGVEHLYGGGPRIGGRINGAIHVSEAYNGSNAGNEIIPDRTHAVKEHFWRTSIGASQRAINTGTPDSLGFSGYYFLMRETVDSIGCDDDGDLLIDEDELDGVDNDGDWNPLYDIGSDGLADAEEVSCDGLPYNATTNSDPAGDNYEPRKTDKCHPNADGTFPPKNNPDLYTEKNGIADHGERGVDEDYGAVSENDLYCSATDTFDNPIVIGHYKMGVKVVQRSYAWSASSVGAILPFEYAFINLNDTITINDVFVGYFADIDLGPINAPNYVTNNYAAYWDSLRTGYIHNAIDNGSTPLAVTILKTPKSLDSLEYVWQWSDFTTRPDPGTDDSTMYTWMDGSAFPNQKIAISQSPTNPSDTRFLFSFGRFALAPHETLKVTIALVSGQAVSGGIKDNLRDNVEMAIKLARKGWKTPIALKSPKLDYEIQDNTVKLKWYPHVSEDGSLGGPYEVWDDSNNFVESFPDTHWRRINPPCGDPSACPGAGSHICIDGKLPGGRTFTGFRLYRSESDQSTAPENTFTLLREYTLPDTATLWSIENMDSTFVDSFLVRGKRYHYSVTAFGIPDITVLPVPVNDTLIRYDTLRSESSESPIGGGGGAGNAKGIDIPFDVSRQSNKVLVVPNPYRIDRDYTTQNGGWEGDVTSWNETKRIVKFIHLPEGEWTLRIFSLVGEEIITISNKLSSGYVVGGKQEDPYNASRGEINWNLLTASGRALASGVYVYSVESKFGTQIDKFVLIR